MNNSIKSENEYVWQLHKCLLNIHQSLFLTIVTTLSYRLFLLFNWVLVTILKYVDIILYKLFKVIEFLLSLSQGQFLISYFFRFPHCLTRSELYPERFSHLQLLLWLILLKVKFHFILVDILILNIFAGLASQFLLINWSEEQIYDWGIVFLVLLP